MASTNNTKILSKDYLAEQLYNYHKKFIIGGVANKQDSLEIVSNHLTWKNNNTLGVNILNDSEAKQNDYIVLENTENGSLLWKTPIEEQENLENSKLLVTGKAVFNFKGSTNINTLGTIKKGTWEAGDITLGEHNLTVNEDGKIIIGKFEINQNSESKISLQIKYDEDSYLTLDSSGELNTASINTASIITDNATIFDLNVNAIKIGNFEIKQNSESESKTSLQIKYTEGSYLTLDSSGELNTKSINTTSLILNGDNCEFATENDFDINNIEYIKDE
jgi:hypothetical protein